MATDPGDPAALARGQRAGSHPVSVCGNIGGQGRLDVTVIGPAVNLVSRIESLCRPLGQPLLATAALARHVDGKLTPIGAHPIRGPAGPVARFALPAAVASARRSA